MRRNNKSKFSPFGFLLFAISIALVVFVAIVIYQALDGVTSKWVILLLETLVVLVSALIFSIIDIYRRRFMVDRPVEKLLEATNKLASGDFDVHLVSEHSFDKYDSYDLLIENFNKMANELSKSRILKTDFISNMSHEIKTPLSIIQNYARAIQNEKLDIKTRNEYLDIILKASNRLTSLVTNILKLNKLENPNFEIVKEKVNMSELLRQSILQFEENIETKGILLTCDIDEIEINSNESCLEIITNNLISNAVKFTDNGGQIFISLKDINNMAVLTVKDNGCGMDKGIGEHIFEKFYQGDQSHAEEGNGLGLAMVKKVIDTLGGQIEVISELNKGSTFIVKMAKE